MSQLICVLYRLPPKGPDGEIIHLQFIKEKPHSHISDIKIER